VAVLGERRLLGLLVDGVIARAVFLFLPGKPRDQRVDLDVELGALLGRSRDDERRACLVDQDGVDLVDDGEG
jgi:hypothetical protein